MVFGITFGADGVLYIANKYSDEVLRYANGTLSPFVPAGSGGLRWKPGAFVKRKRAAETPTGRRRPAGGARA